MKRKLIFIGFLTLCFSIALGAEASGGGYNLTIHGIASGGTARNETSGYEGRFVIGLPLSGESKDLSENRSVFLGLLYSYGSFRGKVKDVDILNKEEWQGEVVVDNRTDEKLQVNVTLQNLGFYTLEGDLLNLTAYRGRNTTSGGGIEEKGTAYEIDCPNLTETNLLEGAQKRSFICNLSVSELDLGVYRLAVILNDKYGRTLDNYSNGSWSNLEPKFFNWELEWGLNNITHKNDTLQPDSIQKINASVCRKTGYGGSNCNLSKVRNESLVFEPLSEFNEIDKNQTVYYDRAEGLSLEMNYSLAYTKFRTSYIPEYCQYHDYFVNVTDQAGLKINGDGRFFLDCFVQISDWTLNKSSFSHCPETLDCYDLRAEGRRIVDRDMNGTEATLLINVSNIGGLDTVQWWAENQDTGELMFNISLEDKCGSEDQCVWSIDRDLSGYECDDFITQLNIRSGPKKKTHHSYFRIEDLQSSVDFDRRVIAGSNQSVKGSLLFCSGSGNYSGINVSLAVPGYQKISALTQNDGSFNLTYQVPNFEGNIDNCSYKARKVYEGPKPSNNNLVLDQESFTLRTRKTGFEFRPKARSFTGEETGHSAYWFTLHNPSGNPQYYDLDLSYGTSPASLAGDEEITLQANETYKGYVDFLPVVIGSNQGVYLSYENQNWSLDNGSIPVTASVQARYRTGILSMRLVSGIHVLAVLILAGVAVSIFYRKEGF